MATLTDQQQKDYFASQNSAANPLSPDAWLKLQGDPQAAPKVTNIQSPAPAPTPTTTPELPQPQAPTTHENYFNSLTGQVDKTRSAVENAYNTQLKDIEARKAESEKKISDLTDKSEAMIETDVQPLLQPFRNNLENSERDRLHVNQNFEENQKLVNELDGLLTQGNQLISGEKSRFAPRSAIQAGTAKAMEDVQARAGVIQAVLSARSGQIAEAENMIDRSVNAITADRKDQLNYYSTVLDFYQNQKDDEGKKLINLEADQKDFVTKKIGLLENDLQQAQDNADYIKKAMTDPATAQAYAQAGVTLNDSPEKIGKKLAAYSYSTEVTDTNNKMAMGGYVPLTSGQSAPPGTSLLTLTDSKGMKRQYYAPVTLSAADKKAAADAAAQAKASVPIALDKIDAANSILTDPGMGPRVGANKFSRGYLFSASKALDGSGERFAGAVHKLVSGMTLANLIAAKAQGAAFGALSEGELSLLANSASAINDWEIKDEKHNGTGYWDIDEADFKKELTTIRDLVQRGLDNSQQSLFSQDELDALNEELGTPAADPANYF
jgi:hypothetical protein